jgi:RimJ/RimL family protein N-acetyltransferase
MRITGADASRPRQFDRDRLILRAPDDRDLDALYTLLQDPVVSAGTTRIPHPYRREDAVRFLADSRRSAQAGDELRLAIERQSDRAFIGVTGFEYDRATQSACLAYWLGRPYWRQGYGSEAVRIMLRHAFSYLELATVKAFVFPENHASLKLLEKAGMRVTGRGLRPAPARGGDREVILHEIPRAEHRE